MALLLGETLGEGVFKKTAEETPLPERYGHTMKVMQPIRQALAWGLSALMLSAVLMGTVACTRGGDNTPTDTTGSDTTVTTPATTNGTGTGTGKPLDPDAGTVDPNGDAGDPLTGTEGGSQGRGILPHRMR